MLCMQYWGLCHVAISVKNIITSILHQAQVAFLSSVQDHSSFPSYPDNKSSMFFQFNNHKSVACFFHSNHQSKWNLSFPIENKDVYRNIWMKHILLSKKRCLPGHSSGVLPCKLRWLKAKVSATHRYLTIHK